MKLKAFLLSSALAAVLLSTTLMTTHASDHDDGEMDLKGRSLNLTDLFVFREDWQDPSASAGNLIVVMNTNPRSLARQQYYFSTQGRYEFHFSRVAASEKNARPEGKDDVTLRFEFKAPNQDGRQPIILTALKDGKKFASEAGLTTTLADMAANQTTVNSVGLDGKTISVFAGLREDPFVFDVERYFRVRGLLATGVNTLTGPTQGGANVFRSNATAVDFTNGYNVNSIVARIPISFLQSSAAEPVFDVWETISVPQ